jgi:biotin carboxyl carrier protein
MQDNQLELVPYSLRIRDTVYPTSVPPHFFKRKRWKRPDPAHIKATIPGTVLQVFAKKGQKVERGDKLAVFVTMKMHNAILAPHAGEVVEVFVKEGDTFPKDMLLFEVRPR